MLNFTLTYLRFFFDKGKKRKTGSLRHSSGRPIVKDMDTKMEYVESDSNINTVSIAQELNTYEIILIS